MSDNRNGDALRFLARHGQSPALDVGGAVGWAPRTCGPKMRSLELQGLVKRLVVKHATPRSDAKYEWALTQRGRELIG